MGFIYWASGIIHSALDKISLLRLSLGWVEFFNFAETFFMKSPLPPESKMVHIIKIGCAQNCHKTWKKWAKIGRLGALD